MSVTMFVHMYEKHRLDGEMSQAGVVIGIIRELWRVKTCCVIKSTLQEERNLPPRTDSGAAHEFLCYDQLFFIIATTLLVVGFIYKASLFSQHIVNYSSKHFELRFFS